MLKSKAKWNFYNHKTETESIMDQLFHERNLFTKEEQQQFLHPKLEHIQAPNHLHQIDFAKERIFQAIEQKESLIVYGDYDADGVTATALLVQVLKDLGAHCDYYIPNRFTEGYGLHTKALDHFKKQGVTLVITVDNGIANNVEAEYAKHLGIDLIITDHHEVQPEIPEALAVIHPSLSAKYKWKHLAGVGVAFQFAHYLLNEMPNHLLDLVAIGTIADLVPLLGENRILTAFGLKQLHKSSNVGLQALKRMCKLNNEITARDVGFLLAPRLNAVGRLQHANLAVELLLTEGEEEAKEIVRVIEELNVKRQQIVSEIVGEAETKVDETDGVIILYDEAWHEGVLGIAASRLVKTFDRPVILLTYDAETDELKGSARSIPAFNLFENGMKIKHLFTKFGGHSQAAGMTFPYENLQDIKEKLNEAITNELIDEDFKPVIEVSKTIKMEEITENIISKINRFAPFGMANSEPIFHFRGKPHQVRRIGQDKRHIKIQFIQDQQRLEAIGFRYGNLFPFIFPQQEIELVGKLQINEWNGNRTIQMIIEDLAIQGWQLFDYRGRQSLSTIQPYLSFFERNLVVGTNSERLKKTLGERNDVTIITYNDNHISKLHETDILYIYDLPDDLKKLQQIIKQTKPTAIHASYHALNDAYLHYVPSREEFKWVYAYLFQNNPIHLNVDLPTMMQIKRWTKEKLIFILKVFLDLQFITIDDNVLYVNKKAEKKELHTSTTYQKRMEQSNIEKALYYSTYEELKQWFNRQLRIGELNKEEMHHGL